jgi:hypothetical protein
VPRWTATRAARARRRADGTFAEWQGGRRLADLPKKANDFQGIAVHIGAQYRKEHGRAARTGDVHRTRKSDGTYHEQAMWYVRTPHGWRKSPTGTVKPSAKVIRAVIAGARPGRKHKPKGK